MAATSLQDFLTKTLQQLTSITDGSTPADSGYIQDKIISPLKDIVNVTISLDYKYLNLENAQDIVYKNIDDLLTSTPAGDGVAGDIDLIVTCKKQLPDEDCIITINRQYTLITSPDRRNFYVIAGANLNKMHFTSITLFGGDSSIDLSNCVFDNAGLTSNSVINLSYCQLQSVLINVDTLNIQDNNVINNCEIKTNSQLVFELGHGNSKMYNCIHNTEITNPSENLTQEFNVWIPSL
jgi:hypothetical protein